MSIGSIRNRVLTKRGKQVVLFKKFDGFGVDMTALDFVDMVVIHYERAVYTAPTKAFRDSGIFWEQGSYGPQLVLPRKFFNITRTT